MAYTWDMIQSGIILMMWFENEEANPSQLMFVYLSHFKVHLIVLLTYTGSQTFVFISNLVLDYWTFLRGV